MAGGGDLVSSRGVLVTHQGTVHDDRAAAMLAGLGYWLRWCCPAVGQSLPAIDDRLAGAVVLCGPQPVDEAGRYPFLKDEMDWIGGLLERRMPQFRICLGSQFLAPHLGAAVEPHPERIHEFGYYSLISSPAGGPVIGESPYFFQAHYHDFDLPTAPNCWAAARTTRTKPSATGTRPMASSSISR